MPRRNVSQLGHQETIDQIFLASQKQLRPNRNGNLYLQVDLSDRSGSLSARMWNAGDAELRGFDDGDFVHVEGTTQVYQGSLQLIATSIIRARPEEVDLADFMILSPAEIDALAVRLSEMLRNVRDPNLQNLAECFLSDEDFMARFARAPAGVKNHHAYPGGLLEHVVSLMEIARFIADRYPAVDRDLLVMGVFLHDMGKIEELQLRKSILLYRRRPDARPYRAGGQHARRQAGPGHAAIRRGISAGARPAAQTHDYQSSRGI